MNDLNYKSQRTSERGQWTKVASNIHDFMTTILSTADCSYVAPHSGRLCVLQWSCVNVNAMCVHTLLFVFLVALGEKNIRSVTCTLLPQFGRIDPHYPKVCGHQGNVLDIKWNPFHDNIIASCSEDSSVSKLKVQNHHDDQISQHHLEKELWKNSFYAVKICFSFFCLFVFVLLMENQHLLFMIWMVKEFYHINLKYYSVKQDQIYHLNRSFIY